MVNKMLLPFGLSALLRLCGHSKFSAAELPTAVPSVKQAHPALLLLLFPLAPPPVLPRPRLDKFIYASIMPEVILLTLFRQPGVRKSNKFNFMD